MMKRRRMCPGHVLCVFLSSYWSVWFSISPQSTVLTQIRFTAFIALLVSLLFAEDTKIGEVQRALPCYSWKYIWNGMQSVNYGTRLQIYCNCGPLDGVLARRIDCKGLNHIHMGLDWWRPTRSKYNLVEEVVAPLTHEWNEGYLKSVPFHPLSLSPYHSLALYLYYLLLCPLLVW